MAPRQAALERSDAIILALFLDYRGWRRSRAGQPVAETAPFAGGVSALDQAAADLLPVGEAVATTSGGTSVSWKKRCRRIGDVRASRQSHRHSSVSLPVRLLSVSSGCRLGRARGTSSTCGQPSPIYISLGRRQTLLASSGKAARMASNSVTSRCSDTRKTGLLTNAAVNDIYSANCYHFSRVHNVPSSRTAYLRRPVAERRQGLRDY